jgi:hypothetical protein
MSDLRDSQISTMFSELGAIVPLSLEIEVGSACSDDDTRGTVEIGEAKYVVHYVRQLSDVQIGLLLAMRQLALPPLVVTDKISQNAAERLRKEDIPFLDTRGNAFINLPGTYVYIVGRNQSVSTPNRKTPGGKLFGYSGIKLIYALLTDPNLDQHPQEAILNGTIREIGAKAQISLGSVSDLFREMTARGYLAEEKDGKRHKRLLLNREELTQKWVHGYCEYRPRKHVVHLQSSDLDWWKNIQIEDHGGLWGGEIAAVLLTDGFLVNPQVATIYTDKTMYGLVLAANLQKVESGGNVELMAPLHGFLWENPNHCVHPLLVYADLLYSADGRNRETAERIHDKYLHSIIHPS